MFGNGIAGNRDRVIKCLTTMRDDPSRLVERGMAGLAALSGCPEVDGRFAAVGFCFGGLAVLALARSGARLAAAVSIHGSLATARPAGPGSVAAKVLVCHGALDPHVPLQHVTEFAEEMNRAGADWQLIMFGGAMHGFTHRDAAAGATPGVAYHAVADERSFAATRAFLADAIA
jgi:dienelactone hydrolase